MIAKVRISHGLIHGLFWMVCIITVIPILFVLNVALKSHQEFLNFPTAIVTAPVLGNFATAWKTADMGRSFINSLILSVCTPLGVCILSSYAAFPICRRHIRGANLFYTLFVVSLFLPMTTSLVPKIRMFQSLGLMNHLYGLILAGWAGIGLPVLILNGYLKGIPRDLDEAAVLDGCGYLRYITLVILPLAVPATATVMLLGILGSWNDFVGPLIFLTDPEKRPLSTGLYMFVGTYSTDYTIMCAGLIIAIAPIVIAYVLGQRYIISGLVSGAIKG